MMIGILFLLLAVAMALLGYSEYKNEDRTNLVMYLDFTAAVADVIAAISNFIR